jgi:NADH-quinone oxidoreductase subunit M
VSLVLLLVVPLIGGGLAWPAERLGPRAPAALCLVSLLVTLLVALPMLHGGAGPWRADLSVPWIPAFGMRFHLGLDGLSWLLTMLTIVLGMFAVLVSWGETREKIGFFYANLMWSLAGTIGVFLALDLFLFFYFWELMLVPMVFVIAIWGHENRRVAAIKFVLFTQGSGLLILIGILALAFLHQRQTGVLSYD